MKVYFEAGLKDLACMSGFRVQTLASLDKASNFKRTHRFLMQVMEAFYEVFYDQFLWQYDVDLCSEEMASKVKD